MGISATTTTAGEHQIARYEISSLTNPAKRSYIVSLYEDGGWRCSCPAWIFKKGADRHDCKHIVAVQQRRGQMEKAPIAAAPRPLVQTPVTAHAPKRSVMVVTPPAPPTGTGMEAFNAGKAAAKPGYTGRRVVDYDFDMLIEEREIVAA